MEYLRYERGTYLLINVVTHQSYMLEKMTDDLGV